MVDVKNINNLNKNVEIKLGSQEYAGNEANFL